MYVVEQSTIAMTTAIQALEYCLLHECVNNSWTRSPHNFTKQMAAYIHTPTYIHRYVYTHIWA